MTARLFVIESRRGTRPPISFTWDAETGQIGGVDAEFLQRWVDAAVRAGNVAIAPNPLAVDITDPLHSALELGAILEGLGYGPVPSPFGDALAAYRILSSLDEEPQDDDAPPIDR